MKMDSSKNKLSKLAIVIFIGIILLFSKKENQEKFINFINITKTANKTLDIVESIPMEENIEDIAFYGEKLIIWGNKKLTQLNIDGSKEWEREFNFDEPRVSFCENNIYVYERPTGEIYIINEMGETIHRVDLKGPVDNILENFDNILVHTKKNNMESINILNQEGQIIENTLIKDKNILTYSMDKDNTTYAIATLNLKGKSLKSEVQLFKLNGQPLYDMEFNNQIILYSSFINKGKLLVMTDTTLYCINNGSILWQKEFQLIKDIYVDKGKISLLYGNKLEILSMDGETEEKYSFTEEYKKIISYDKYLSLYGNEYIIGLKDKKEIFKYKSENGIVKVVNGGQYLIVFHEDKIILMSL